MIASISRQGSLCSLTASSKDLQFATELADQQTVKSNIINPNPSERGDKECQSGQQNINIKTTWKRYVILLLFCINWSNKSLQWMQVCSVTEKLTYYYNVSSFMINATSVLFMLPYVFLCWPACYLIERIGIRNAVLIASFGASLGSVLKCFSCSEQGIYLLFISQILVSCSEMLIFAIPNRLASVWFPDNQVSSAVAISVLGSQLGVALGFVVPQYFLSQMESKEEIGQGLYQMFIVTAVISIVAFLSSFALFDEAPKHPPGLARLRQIEIEKQLKIIGQGQTRRGFFEEISNLLGQVFELTKDIHLLLLTLSFGINVGLGYTVSTILNQMLVPLWKGEDIFVGNTGFLIIVSGALCSAFWGKLLDKLHQYLWINIFLTLGSMASLIVFAYVISAMHSMIAIYLAAILYGSFQTGIFVAGLELAVELTYPTPELLTSSLLNVTPQIFGTIFIFVSSYIVDNFGALASCIFLVACMPVSLIALFNIKETRKRQDAAVEKINSFESASKERKLP